MEISTEIVISAPPAKVWARLTAFDQYPKWNPFIKSLVGEVSVGKKITVRLEPPGGQGMTIKPVVQALEPNKEFRWLGHLFVPGFFDGEHSFQLIDNGNGTTTFRHSEKFKGILIPLFRKMLNTTTLNGFRLMNEKLKELAEKD